MFAPVPCNTYTAAMPMSVTIRHAGHLEIALLLPTLRQHPHPVNAARAVPGKPDAASLKGKGPARGRTSSNGASGWADVTNVHEGWEVDPEAQDEAEVGKGARIIGSQRSHSQLIRLDASFSPYKAMIILTDIGARLETSAIPPNARVTRV